MTSLAQIDQDAVRLFVSEVCEGIQLVGATARVSTSDGFIQSRVCRGRLLSLYAKASRSASVNTERLVIVAPSAGGGESVCIVLASP